MQKCRQHQPSPVLERFLTNWWSSHHDCPSENFHAGRAIKLATKGVHIFDLFKTPRLSLLSVWCAKVQAAAAVACAREVLNKCVWPCGSIVWWSSHRDATSYQIICFELNVINKLYCRAHKILLHPAWIPSSGPAASTNSSLFTLCFLFWCVFLSKSL